MSSADAKPDSIMRIADNRYGMSNALTMKPARSLLFTTRLPNWSAAKDWALAVVLGRGQERADQFDEMQHRHRVEEVDADDLLRAGGWPYPAS